MKIAQILTEHEAISQETRLKADALLSLTGFKDKRALQAAIRRERLGGALIMATKACGGGFWLTTDRHEAALYGEKKRREGVAQIASGKAAREFSETTEGQSRLTGVD